MPQEWLLFRDHRGDKRDAVSVRFAERGVSPQPKTIIRAVSCILQTLFLMRRKVPGCDSPTAIEVDPCVEIRDCVRRTIAKLLVSLPL